LPQVGSGPHFDHCVPATIVIQEKRVDGVLGSQAVSFQMPLTRLSWLDAIVLDASNRPSDATSGERAAKKSCGTKVAQK
jgi:hypothetical protein